MGNMSYCLFQNTLQDLDDCLDALEERGLEDLSNEEKRAAINLVRTAARISDEFLEEAEAADDADRPSRRAAPSPTPAARRSGARKNTRARKSPDSK
jgi:hypothetical protein